jgi:transcriptional antiterminator NusG
MISGSEKSGSVRITLFQNQPNHSWYALHIRSRHQQYVAEALNLKGYEIFAPSYRVVHQSGDRKKIVEKPLFPGYMFCALDPNERLPVLTVHGVISILGTGSRLTPVEPEEVESVRRMVQAGVPTEPYQLLEPGVALRIEHGPLRGVRGVLVTHRGSRRLVITVGLLNRSIAAEIDSHSVTTVSFPRSTVEAQALRVAS